MSQELLLTAASVMVVLSSIGALLTRDNLYAALYMSVAMMFVAAIYAIYDLQPVVVMIVLIFVGAVGIVTVAIAATYRAIPSRKVSLIWTAPAIIVFAVAVFAYSQLPYELRISSTDFGVVPTQYFGVILLLFAAIILMAISAIKIARRVEL
ncbi:MAG: hypothetical protein ABWW66_06425 [Archaeoglobaceae archaeon]